MSSFFIQFLLFFIDFCRFSSVLIVFRRIFVVFDRFLSFFVNFFDPHKKAKKAKYRWVLSEGFAGDDKDDSSDDEGEKIKSEAEDPQKLKEKLEREKMIRSEEFNKIGDFEFSKRRPQTRDTVQKRKFFVSLGRVTFFSKIIFQNQ